MRRIFVAVPAREHVHAKFTQDLVSAVTHHVTHHPDDGVMVTIHEGTLIQAQRQELAELAIAADATHILYIDSDMRFPHDLIGKMLEHDVDVLSVNCSKRIEPVSPTAKRRNGEGYVTVWPDVDVEGLESVSIIGFGVVMMRMSALQKMPKPWFQTPWYPDKEFFVGEDTYFCAQASKHDVEVYIDHDLSWDVLHLGTRPYGMMDLTMEAARGN